MVSREYNESGKKGVVHTKRETAVVSTKVRSKAIPL